MSAVEISRKEKYSRCVALEEDYVHRVYESIGKELAQARDPMQDTVRQFLDELEPGSLVADIGKLRIFQCYIISVFLFRDYSLHLKLDIIYKKLSYKLCIEIYFEIFTKYWSVFK